MRYRFDPAYPSGHPTNSGTDARIRASDAERNEVAERLSRHFADGRLDQPEFQERLGRAMGATTRGDLGGLFDDLPRLDLDPPPPGPRPRRLRPLIGVAAVLLLVTWVVGTTASFLHLPWLLLALVGLFAWRRGRRRHAGREAGLGSQR